MKLQLFLSCLLSYIFYKVSFATEISRIQANLWPMIEKCNYMKDLFDDERYLKTACVVTTQSLSYERAKYKCAEYNMNLFVLDDEIVTSHLLDLAQE